MKNFLKKKNHPRRRKSRSSEVRVNRYISSTKKNKKEVNNQRKISKRKRYATRVLLAGGVLIVVSIFLYTSSRITEVFISSEQLKYRSEIDDHLNRNPFARLKPFFSSQALQEHVTSSYPEVASVETSFTLFGGIMNANVVERQAQLVLKTGEGDYYIVDADGYVYDTFDIVNKTDKMVILTDDTEASYRLGSSSFVSTNLIVFIEEVDSIFRGIDGYSTQVFSYRITDEPRTLYIKPSSEKYEVKMQIDRSSAAQVESLKNALKFYKNKSIEPLKYIDVRIDGTVYYK